MTPRVFWYVVFSYPLILVVADVFLVRHGHRRAMWFISMLAIAAGAAWVSALNNPNWLGTAPRYDEPYHSIWRNPSQLFPPLILFTLPALTIAITAQSRRAPLSRAALFWRLALAGALSFAVALPLAGLAGLTVCRGACL